MKNFTVKMSQEQANYLQRLGQEVDGKAFIIDRMFATHAMDEDTMIFESVPFKHFMKQFEEANAEFDFAKQEFQDTYLKGEVEKLTGIKDPVFNWQIDNYNALEVKVMM